MKIAGYNLWPLESIRFRLFAAFSLMTLFISATFAAIHIYKEIDSFNSRTGEKAHILATELATAIRLPLFAEDNPTLARHATETARYAGVHRVAVISPNNRVLAETSPNDRQPGGGRIFREVDVRPELLENSVEEMYGASYNSGPSLGRVLVEMDESETHAFIRSLLLTSLITTLFFWIVISGFGIILVTRITRSLTPLSDGIEAIKLGDYRARIATTGNDEIAEAATAINGLADELEKREAENRRLQQELLDSMKNEVREERRRIMAKLIQTNRMTSLGLLVSSTAHEINTPNGAIRLAGQQIAKSWSDAVPILDRVASEEGDFVLGGMNYPTARDQLGKSMDVILRSSERIDRVVGNLREYAAGEQNRLENRVCLNEVIGDALTMIRAHGRHVNVAIDNRANQDIPPVNGSKPQLEQVVTNLILNSVQAIPEERSGSVVVTTGYDEAVGEVLVTVSDNGEGIPEALRDHLFEPFFSTRLEQGGSGLGLYISNFIVKDHAGALTFKSTPGEGTVFTVRLPAAV